MFKILFRLPWSFICQKAAFFVKWITNKTLLIFSKSLDRAVNGHYSSANIHQSLGLAIQCLSAQWCHANQLERQFSPQVHVHQFSDRRFVRRIRSNKKRNLANHSPVHAIQLSETLLPEICVRNVFMLWCECAEIAVSDEQLRAKCLFEYQSDFMFELGKVNFLWRRSETHRLLWKMSTWMHRGQVWLGHEYLIFSNCLVCECALPNCE